MARKSSTGKDPEDILTWEEITTTSTTCVKSHGYIANNAATVSFHLPVYTSTDVGKKVAIVGKGAGGWLIGNRSGIDGFIFSSGIYYNTERIGSTNQYDSAELTCSWNSNYCIHTISNVVGTLAQSNAGIGLLAEGAGTSIIITHYLYIDTLSNSSQFGNLTIPRYREAGCGSATRGLFGGGMGDTDFAQWLNSIDYFTFSWGSVATDFGDLTFWRYDNTACSNSTRGVFCGGMSTDGYTSTNVMDYVTISTLGNAADFGDSTIAKYGSSGLASTTRGVFGGGYTVSAGAYVNVMDYITIASAGNATDFGDLASLTGFCCGCASSTRGVFMGGWVAAPINVMQYITIASTGNTTDFGDLSEGKYGGSAFSSLTRGIYAAGTNAVGIINTIEYITIASTGNATDFGDTYAPWYLSAGCSNVHGGI